ncbi:hypothetical protein AB5J55_24605 [Streptomyces sp. R11]|uniref:Uncharacterized protein n=1 Tax=Streptomyces sp. R11 TaxID=3238625 RepID=A0AB39N407_9ACTN
MITGPGHTTPGAHRPATELPRQRKPATSRANASRAAKSASRSPSRASTLLKQPLPDATREQYDRAARVTGDDVPSEGARQSFTADGTLRTPDTVTCFAPFNGESG